MVGILIAGAFILVVIVIVWAERRAERKCRRQVTALRYGPLARALNDAMRDAERNRRRRDAAED